MKNVFTIIFLFATSMSFAQIDYKEEAKRDLKKFDSIFNHHYTELSVARDSLKTLTEQLSPSLTTYYEYVTGLKKKVDSLYLVGDTSIKFYQQKGVHKDTIGTVFTLPKDYTVGAEGTKPEPEAEESIDESKEEKTYIVFGSEELILKDSILKDSIANKVFKNVIGTESENHFGDFWFPEDGADVILKRRKCSREDYYSKYIEQENENEVKCEDLDDFRTLKFDRLTIELYEGNIRDLKVYLKNDKGNSYIFENTFAISLLTFNASSEQNKLVNTAKQTFKDDDIESDFTYYELRVSDVLRYYTGLDGNYVPNDESFSFPFSIDGEKTNKGASNRYELRQSTSLNNIIDLRAYTDILGLAGDSANGIAQFDGQAQFFVQPFSKTGRIFYFKKIKPYVSFTRLDEDDRVIRTENVEGSDNIVIPDRLDFLQQSFLDTGIKLDLLTASRGKSFPYEIGYYAAFRYQISKIEVNSEQVNYQGFGYGVGVFAEFRRFKNFKFNYSLEFNRYNLDRSNNIENLIDPDAFWVLRNEAEVSYFPNNKINNAIFLRMRVFNNFKSDEARDFLQLQFGYRFTIGVGKVKANNN